MTAWLFGKHVEMTCAIPWCGWVLEQWHEADAIKLLRHRKLRGFHEGRVNVHQPPTVASVLLPAGTPLPAKISGVRVDSSHNVRLGPVLLFAEVESVITPQHDNRVVRVRPVERGIRNRPHAVIHKADARREIRVTNRATCPPSAPRRVTGRRLSAVGLCSREYPSCPRSALRQRERLAVVKIEPFLRHEQRHMRTVETGGEEERFLLLLFEKLRRLERELIIAHLLVAFGKCAEIPSSTGQFTIFSGVGLPPPVRFTSNVSASRP